MMRKLFYILLLLGISGYTHGQDVLAGLQYGLGNQHFKRGSDGHITADYLTHQIGLQLEYSPYYSLLFINTGAALSFNELGKEITIPLSFMVAPGKKLRPFAELGAYYSLVLTDEEDAYRVNNDLGILFRGGFLYSLNDKIDIELSYRYHLGLTTRLEEDIRLPLDQTATEEYRSSMKGISLGIKYQLY